MVIIMKTKFQRISKEEKKQAIEDYKNSAPNRKDVVKRVTRVMKVAGIGALYSLILTIYNIVQDKPVYEIQIGAAALIGCIILIKVAYDLLAREVNNYLVGNLKGKDKADYRKGIDTKKKKNK